MIVVLMITIIVIGSIIRYIVSIDDFGESDDTLTDEEREEAYREWNEAFKQMRAEERWGSSKVEI